MQPMLSLWRRHLKSCPFSGEGRKYTKCACPIWCDGDVKGQRVRRSMDTRNWARAARKMGELEQTVEEGKESKPFASACDAFMVQVKVEPSTETKYERWVKFLKAFAESRGIELVADWTLEELDAYRATRTVGELTWSKELQFLRQLFKWFGKRKWIQDNPARELDMPKEPKPAERQPYTQEDIVAILRACDEYGRHPYERLRARALVTLQRRYGLRISDAATLKRSRITGDQIAVRAQKNGATIWAPLYPDVKGALERLPIPRGSKPDAPYFFWAGPHSSTAINFVKTMERSMKAVFDRSGVENGHTHRFRHTLATDILTKGGSYEDVAEILGDDVETVKKHYAKWNRAYQQRITSILNRVHLGTSEAHDIFSVVSASESTDKTVAKVGVELPDSTKKQ